MIQKRILGEVRQEKTGTSKDIDLNDEDILFLEYVHLVCSHLRAQDPWGLVKP